MHKWSCIVHVKGLTGSLAGEVKPRKQSDQPIKFPNAVVGWLGFFIFRNCVLGGGGGLCLKTGFSLAFYDFSYFQSVELRQTVGPMLCRELASKRVITSCAPDFSGYKGFGHAAQTVHRGLVST